MELGHLTRGLKERGRMPNADPEVETLRISIAASQRARHAVLDTPDRVIPRPADAAAGACQVSGCVPLGERSRTASPRSRAMRLELDLAEGGNEAIRPKRCVGAACSGIVATMAGEDVFGTGAPSEQSGVRLAGCRGSRDAL
jgi:hypothetical protein